MNVSFTFLLFWHSTKIKLKDYLWAKVCAMCLVWCDPVMQLLVIDILIEECERFSGSFATQKHKTSIFCTAMVLNVLFQER